MIQVKVILLNLEKVSLSMLLDATFDSVPVKLLATVYSNNMCL